MYDPARDIFKSSEDAAADQINPDSDGGEEAPEVLGKDEPLEGKTRVDTGRDHDGKVRLQLGQ